jgi:hypothetical protein
MPRIRCRYLDCVFLDDGFCSSSSVDIDPDEGCLTFTMVGDEVATEEWDEDEKIEELWDVEDVALLADDEEEDDEDLWLDEEV